MELVEAPWTKDSLESAGNAAKRFRKQMPFLKIPVSKPSPGQKNASREGRVGAKRVILTDCLDICPEGKVSVMRVVPGQAVQVSTIDSLDLLGDLFQQ